MHKDSGCECMVAHFDVDLNILPGCIQCSKCHEYIRPEKMLSLAKGTRMRGWYLWERLLVMKKT